MAARLSTREMTMEMEYAGSDEEAGSEASDLLTAEVEDFDEDTYGSMLSALIRDSWKGSKSGSHVGLRVARTLASLALLYLSIAIQFFLLREVKAFVTSKAVHDVRIDYGAFEETMYTKQHTTMTVNGYPRGDDPSHFDKGRFELLSEDQKMLACRIPFSQPNYFSIILVIWTLTLIGEMKRCWLLLERLVIRPSCVSSMQHSCEPVDEADLKGEGQLKVVGLTGWCKALITVVVLIPRFGIACYLLWLGCRWLTATNNFADLILNAVALEFILFLRDLFYVVLVPARNKRDMAKMKLDVSHESGPPTGFNMLGTYVLLGLSLLWVYIYVTYLQQVLPDYKWDVHEVCTEFLETRYSV